MSFFHVFLSSFLVLTTSGCTTNAGTGVIAGVAVGGGLGGAMRGAKGGMVGSLAGVAAGALIGTSLDLQDRKVIEKSSPRTVDRMDRGDPLTLNDVIKLSQGGVNDEMIMRYMRDSGSLYSLSQAQVRRLQDAGVSQRVINYMMQAGQ